MAGLLQLDLSLHAEQGGDALTMRAGTGQMSGQRQDRAQGDAQGRAEYRAMRRADLMTGRHRAAPPLARSSGGSSVHRSLRGRHSR